MSLAYSRKHWRHKFKPYLRIIPWLLEQARLEKTTKCQHFHVETFKCNFWEGKSSFERVSWASATKDSPQAWSLTIFTGVGVPQILETHFLSFQCVLSVTRAKKKEREIPTVNTAPQSLLKWQLELGKAFFCARNSCKESLSFKEILWNYF